MAVAGTVTVAETATMKVTATIMMLMLMLRTSQTIATRSTLLVCASQLETARLPWHSVAVAVTFRKKIGHK
jgi:hypothetical protein